MGSFSLFMLVNNSSLTRCALSISFACCLAHKTTQPSGHIFSGNSSPHDRPTPLPARNDAPGALSRTHFRDNGIAHNNHSFYVQPR